jgi:YHS domain-containing protein
MKTLTIDPVCGTEVGPHSRFHVEHHATTYYFCCDKCRLRFVRDPGEFIYPEGADWEGLARELDGHVLEPDHDSTGSLSLGLIVIATVSVLVAFAGQISRSGSWDWVAWLCNLVGSFLVISSAFEFIGLNRVPTLGRRADPSTRLLESVAFFYPFVGLVLGLGFLAGQRLMFVAAAAAVLHSFYCSCLIAGLRRGTGAGPQSSEALSAAALIAHFTVATLAIVIFCFAHP